MNKLVKAKITFTTEIVVENHYHDDLIKSIESAWDRNKKEIISQEVEEIVISDVAVVKSLKDLPPRWEGKCLPWLPHISYGNAKQEQKIEEFFKK